MNYQEAEVKLRDNGIFPEQEVLVKRDTRKVVALRLTAFNYKNAEVIEKRLQEVFRGIDYMAVYMPSPHNYISIVLT
jgi:hypothetical protein